MRDLDWGAYPFVTSSCPTPAGMVAGAGVPSRSVERVIGVVKAYTTAVGAGPFPTELFDSKGDDLREKGGEFGATTGRPRRCGWYDAVAVKWACRVAGFTELALTKIDVLDGEPTLPICVDYKDGDKTLDSFPTTDAMARVKPVYKDMTGWSEKTTSARKMEELPKTAQDYVEELERLAGVPISMVSVGPERDSIIERGRD
jgi:adenylosuccinate synthase